MIALANKAVEKAIVDKSLVKKRSKYLVALDAASSFIPFHAARSLELLDYLLPCKHARNFGVKNIYIFVDHPLLRNFNTKIYNMKICNTNISVASLAIVWP